MNKLDIFITLIFIFKIIFICLAVYLIIIKHKKTNEKRKIITITFWKERIEFIFIAMMSILLIYLFNPRYNNLIFITNETKLLLFLFGIVLILTANWGLFIKESPFFINIKNALGNEGNN